MYYQRSALYHFFDTLFRHRKLFLITVALVIFIVIVAIKVRPAQYSATTTIFINSRQQQNPLGPDNGAESSYQALQRMTMLLTTRVGTQEFLRDALSGPDGQPAFLHKPVNLSNPESLSNLVKAISVTTDNMESMTVNVLYDSPDDAATIRDGIVNTFLMRDIDEKSSYFSQQVAFLTEQSNDYKQKLDAAEANLASWKKSHLDVGSGAGASQQDLSNLKERSDELHVQIQSGDERIAALSNQLAHTPKTVVAVERLAGGGSVLQTRLDSLKEDLAEDQAIKNMTPDHPLVIALKKEIKYFEGRIAEQKRTGSTMNSQDLQPNPTYSNLQNEVLQSQIDVRALQTELSDVQARLAKESTIVGNDPDNEKQYAELTRVCKNYDDHYNVMLDQLEKAKMYEQISRREVNEQYVVVRQTAIPMTGAKKTAMMFFGGILLALVLGGCVVYISEWLDPAFRDPQDVQRTLGVSVLAMLPEITEQAQTYLLGGKDDAPGDRKKLSGAHIA